MTTDVAPQSLQLLAQHLQQTLNPSTRKQAEAALMAMESNPNYASTLLQLVQLDSTTQDVRFAAVLLFKNFVRRVWPEDATAEGQAAKLTVHERNTIKSNIVNLMISLPEKFQTQLSEAVSIMAFNDFPHAWGNLVQDLVQKLSPTDYNVNAGVLQTAHSIFKSYRHAFRSDELFLEIKFVLGQFCVPFLQLFQNTDALITQYQNDRNALQVLFNSLHLMCKIYFSLNFQDLPEFFEDHQKDFMPIFLKYLAYQNANIATQDDDEAGALEKVKTSICEIADLYAKKYEETFTALPQFVEAIWLVLTTIGPEPRNDLLVSTAISFLSSVARHQRHRSMFESPDSLKNLVEKIILPNMQLRDSDVDQFEDDPIEFIRRNLEGSDSDTRRRSASDLVRSLSEQFESSLTAIFGEYIQHFLQKYQASPSTNWKDKDTAIFLIIAISARAATSQLGATKTNSSINIAEILSSHILADLQAPPNSAAIHPVLKVDAINFLNTFRHQFTKEQLSTVFPLVVAHLTATNYVVHTYAAVCLERVLFMKQNGHLLFNAQDIQPYTETLLTNLFKLIEAGQTPEKISENDYLMKTVMRVIYIARQTMEPYVLHIFERLTKILEIISKNPSNPKFNHYVFESIGSLIRFLCSENPKLVTQFETFLFPPMQAILQLDIPEFTPYVFQILSQLLEFHQEKGIPAPYQPLLGPILQPVLWDLSGNIPALVRLLEAFLARGGEELVQTNKLPAFLGIFQKLIASRLNDHYGFDLLTSIFQHIPIAVLKPYMKPIFNVLLLRLQSSKTAKFTGGFVKFITTMVCTIKSENIAQILVEEYDSIQPKLFFMVVQGVMLPEMKQITDTTSRKVCAVAFVKLLTQSDAFRTADYLPLWLPMMIEILNICKSPMVKDNVLAEEEDDILALDADEAGYQSAFARLHSIAKIQTDPAADVQDLAGFTKAQLVPLLTQAPEVRQQVIQGLPSDLKALIAIN